MRIVECPNLPESKVKTALVSKDISEEIRKSLEKLDIKLIEISGQGFLDRRIANHPDMNFIHCSGSYAVTYLDPAYIRSYLTSDIQIDKFSQDITGDTVIKYPQEASLDALFLQEHLFCGVQSVNNLLINYAKDNKIKIIGTKQGYVKCSVCVVDENAIITEDRSLADDFAKLGYDVLLLKTKSVKLSGYSCGFIGGASGKISKDTLAFFGCIEQHVEYNEIYKFCNEHGVNIISLSYEPLTDYGSLIPLEEE